MKGLTRLNPSKVTSLSSESSLAKTYDNNQMPIEKESLTQSKTDNTDTTVSEVQTNILESEKINIPSSKIDSALLSAKKAKDSEETSLNPPKVTSLFSDISLAKLTIKIKSLLKNRHQLRLKQKLLD